MTFGDSLARKVEDARRSAAYANYLRAREAVVEMLDAADADPSEYWADELENVEYLLDASPLIVEQLRRHCYHVTGIWPYNYRAHRDAARDQHRAKLDALLELGGGSDLFVPESPALGGFGFALDEGLVNLDTLKFFEALLALQRGEVLAGLRESGERRIVWEIGAGWGGFAYQLKTLFPNVTYVITDLPQLFLYSGTYLPTLFPDASVHFCTHGDVDDWLRHDFVFVPSTALAAVTPPRLDLVVNMVSFQEMTTEQVRAYSEHAHALEAPFVYSLNRERSNYNPELDGVGAILSERFWLHELKLLPVSYQQMLDRKVRADDPNRYRHLIGWRRTSA